MKKIILFIIVLTSYLVKAQNFTDTKGELQISNSGTASYTLPIAMPPSIKNVAPVINLVYNSGARGGIAGQGWSINSISNISRMATRNDIDGFRDGVDFDDNDKLALDGQRLLIKTGTYWADGSTYETEYKSNTKIELKVESAQIYFIVTSPDGSRTWYGSTGNGVIQNATSANAWYIIRFEDVYSNYITYNYMNVAYNSTNQLYISDINFSGNESQGIVQLNQIVFNYRNAQRVERDYINGNAMYATKILDNIQVLTDSVLFRKYQLIQISDDEGYERVKQVQEFNGLGEASNPITFVYDTSSNTGNRIEKEYNDNLAFDSVRLAGDFDGDGRIDFGANNQLYINLFSGGGGNAPLCSLPNGGEKLLTTTTLSDNKLNQAQSIVSVQSTPSNTQFKVFNLNQNQFVENYTINFPLNRNTINTYSNDTGSTYGVMCNSYYQNYFPPVAQNSIVEYNEGDFNGDGISEIFVKITKTDNHYINGPALPNPIPNPFDLSLCNLTNNQITTVKYYLVDLNNSSSSYSYKELTVNYPDGLNGTKYYTDFNGDGKTDILVMKQTGEYLIYTYNSYNLELLGVGTIGDFDQGKQMLFGDYNGDGKTDIALPTSSLANGYSGSVNWAIYYSNPNPNGGEFFISETQDIVEYWSDTEDYYNTQRHWSTYYAIDVNKDGKSDIVRVWRKYYKPEWTINDHNTAWQGQLTQMP